jgi:hypothetical protein
LEIPRERLQWHYLNLSLPQWFTAFNTFIPDGRLLRPAPRVWADDREVLAAALAVVAEEGLLAAVRAGYLE